MRLSPSEPLGTELSTLILMSGLAAWKASARPWAVLTVASTVPVSSVSSTLSDLPRTPEQPERERTIAARPAVIARETRHFEGTGISTARAAQTAQPTAVQRLAAERTAPPGT